MTGTKPRRAFGTGGSVPVETCQACGSADLESVMFVGYLPPVTTMPPVGSRLEEQPAYPAELLRCAKCTLVQLGLVVDPKILFAPSYPYLSGTTKLLRDDFTDLYREIQKTYPLAKDDLVVDIGSNDGTLLGNFKDGGYRVLGIEPTNIGLVAQRKGITTDIAFFDKSTTQRALRQHGKARVITATNVFAHIEDVHDVLENVLSLLHDDGIFASETHYWVAMLEMLEYDRVYHEHLRYYTVTSLSYLLGMHGLEIIRAKRIPTHGGSIRVYAARKGKRKADKTVKAMLASEKKSLAPRNIERFCRGVVDAKLALLAMLRSIKKKGKRVYGVGAPSRATSLIHYVGLDDGMLDCVLEMPGSEKIGKYAPGTRVPVVDESRLAEDPPDYALLFSWHIAEELIPKLKKKGFKGKFIVPLPEPRVVR